MMKFKVTENIFELGMGYILVIIALKKWEQRTGSLSWATYHV